VRSLDTVLKRLQIDKIDLDPDFQRSRGIWTEKKKSQLIESLLLRIPLPTFYVAEMPDEGGLGDDRWAVVDGIQRLSTIAEFVVPETIGLTPLVLHGLQYLSKEEGKKFAELSPALQLRVPSLSTSGETLTIEESMTLRARMENAGYGDEHEWSWGSG